MLNLDTDLDVARAARLVKTVEQHPAPAVTETVTVAPVERRGFLAKEPSTWTWGDLRDYVVSEVERRNGAQVRNAKREYGIFTRFLKTWGTDAVAIARYAFEVADGVWNNAPITVSRFTKNSDPYFAEVIAARLKNR